MTLKELKKSGLTLIEIWNVVLKSADLQDEYQKEYPEWNLGRAQKLVALCSKLKSENVEEKHDAIMSLIVMGNAVECVPELAKILKDQDSTIRQMAIAALDPICDGEKALSRAMLHDNSMIVNCLEQVSNFLKKKAIRYSPEYFSYIFSGRSWKIIAEDGLWYKVEVDEPLINEKLVYQFKKDQYIFDDYSPQKGVKIEEIDPLVKKKLLYQFGKNWDEAK